MNQDEEYQRREEDREQQRERQRKEERPEPAWNLGSYTASGYSLEEVEEEELRRLPEDLA
jgi:hypothetical protein